jgi:hypothetical protein
MPPKVLVWNTRGDQNNQHTWITTWAAGTVPYNTLDWAIFVESGTGSHHAGSSVVPEAGGAGLNLTTLGNTDPFFAACATLMGVTNIAANAGVGQLRNYEIASPAGTAVPGTTVIPFESSMEIAKWCMRPLEPYINMVIYNAPPPPPVGGGGGGGPIRRSGRNQGAANPYASTQPPWLVNPNSFRAA